jgi:Zn-dependent peptidase ImmA (M78 family)/DNA-binding XRE family transcriptional regulator
MPGSYPEWEDLAARLAEARKVARLSQADLAAAIGLDRTAITRVEACERKLAALELARIARVLRRPIEWFLSEPVPSVVSRRQSRAAVDESEADILLESIAGDVRLMIELKVLWPPNPPSPTTMEDISAAEIAARELRRQLGLGHGPVTDLHHVAASMGMYGFTLLLGDDSLDGSYLRSGDVGVALINGSKASGRRRFTFVHELGHHYFADAHSAEWIIGDGDDRERLINAFAIHFLMPREAITNRWTALEGEADPRQAAIALGAEFIVSWTAVIGHLCNLNFIDAAMHDRLKSSRPTKADYLEAGVVLREDLIPPSLPPAFSQAVIRGFRRHKVSEERACELLRGTLRADELPDTDQVPPEAMLGQLQLE